jgi:hypothetical protein
MGDFDRMQRGDAFKLPPLKAAKVVRLQPGDVLVLVCEDQITKEQAALLTEYGEQAFPGHKVVVLSGGLDIKLIRPERARG